MRLTEYVHICLEHHLRNGDRVLDATAGNGHDTLKAARLVQPSGQVISVDIQMEAIEATEKKLVQAKLNPFCQLHLGNHGIVLKDFQGHFKAILFNLGYLPGSDKSVISKPESTRSALIHSAQLLDVDGLLFVTVYRQHLGGQMEASQVAEWMRVKQSQGWAIEKIEPVHQSKHLSPILWIASKNSFKLPSFYKKSEY